VDGFVAGAVGDELLEAGVLFVGEADEGYVGFGLGHWGGSPISKLMISNSNVVYIITIHQL